MKVKPIWISNSKGETGIQGIQGNTGLNGVTGLNGATGVIGLDGVTGVIGATGFQGVTGIGVTGSKGETGAQGTIGQIGFTGFKGETGISGEQGETGVGTMGLPGDPGIQGVTGIAPEPSECAYIYYQGKYSDSLSANQTMFGSDMPTIDENEFVSSVSGEIYLDYVNGGFKVPSDIRFINVSLNFAFGFTTGDSGVYKDFRYNLVSGDEGFGATGTDTKIIASGSIQPPDTVDSYTSCSAITVDTDTFGKYINVIWLGDTIDPEEIQFSISLNSIAGIQGETGIQGIPGSSILGEQGETGLDGLIGSTGIQGETGFGLNGQQGSTGVQGIGEQGVTGLIGATGSIGSTGASIKGDQGFTGVIGLQGVTGVSSGGSSVSEVSHISSMDGGGASDIVAMQAGSSTQWSAHGVMTAPFGQITPVADQSTIGFIASQVATGSFIAAIYKVETTGIHSLICESAITAIPVSPSWVSTLVSSVESGLYIPANERVYLVVMTDANGVSMSGKSSTNLNLQPYVAGIKTNMGVLTAAPKTIQWESETNTRPFIYLTK